MKGQLHESVWRHRDVRIVVPGRALSLIGDGMLTVVLLLHLHDGGYGALAVTGLMVIEAMPLVALIGVAGRIADSHDSRMILVSALVVQSIACVVLATDPSLFAIYLLVAVLQTAQAVISPTWSGLTPRLVGEDEVGRLVALNQGLAQTLVPVGAALGGLAYGVAGMRLAVLVDAATFAALAVAAYTVRTRRGGALVQSLTHADWRDGLRVLRADHIVWPLFVASIPFVGILVGTNVVEVFLVRDDLGMSAQWYGFADLVMVAGAIPGAVLAGRIASDDGRVRAVLGSFLMLAVCVVICGMTPWFWLFLVMVLGIGLAAAVMSSCFGALFILRTPEEFRGRVSSAVNGVLQAASIVSLVVVGGIGAAVGARPTFVVAGAAAFVVVLVAAPRVLARASGERVTRRRSLQPTSGDGA
ncbi:MFS transporter [Flexivirga alba]|uniref:MFS transporter n=1 Tax=Flexivirga alba TaxID=702742 RepID=A0ABW2AEI2_9MICO